MLPESPSRPPRRSPSPLWLLALALWLGTAVVSATILWHLRSQALDAQSREIGLLSLALSDEMERGLRGVEAGLDTLRQQLNTRRLPGAGAGTDQTLATLVQVMPLVRSLCLIDSHGHPLATSGDGTLPDIRSFYPALDAIDGNTPAIGRAFGGASGHDDWVALAVRADSAPGTGGGWIVASLPASALLGAFSVAAPVTDARMVVLRRDGVRLAGGLSDAPPVDAMNMVQRLAERPSLYVHRFHDGSERLVGQRSLPRYGLIMVLTRDMKVVLAPWHYTALISAAGMVLLLLVLIATVQLVLGAGQRQERARQALQVQRSRAGKLEALGALAGGVAHDFNNILAAIIGFGEMAQDAAVPDSNQSRHLDKVLQAALRGKALAERILKFSRGGAHSMIVFELEPVIDEVLALLAVSLPAGVTLERRNEAPGACLRGDPTQTFEAIMNLCTNAMQSMAQTGGVLGVHLQRVHVASPTVLSHSQLASGDYLLLSVSDQGVGISAEVMERLFEPFFTTRGARSGTGLGLAIVHGVVAELGGVIDVSSVPGRGSVFRVFLRECGKSTEATVVPRNEVPSGTGQQLLIVDDDPALVALTEEMMRELGYQPYGYADPDAALAVLRDAPQRFDAVITDEVMPSMSGTELTRVLRTFAPDVPVLLISGFGGASLAARAAASGVTRVLSKPVQRAELARALDELLGATRSSVPS